MPQAKKSTPKKSNVARSNKVNTKFKFKPWHAVAGLALFIAGGFVVAYSQASSEGAATKAQLPLIQYEEGNAAAIAVKEGSSSKLVQGPKTIQLTQTGELFCFGENQDQGATRKLTKTEVTQVLSDISGSGLVELPAPSEDQVQVETKLIRYIDPKTGAIVGINLNNVTSENTSYLKAVGILQSACAKNTQPTQRKNAPEIKVKTNTPTTMNLPAIQRAVVGTAQAGSAPPDPKIAWLNRYNDVLREKVETARVKNGLPVYVIIPCLGISASNWSSTMATNYNNNVAAKENKSLPIIYHSKVLDVIDAACGPNYSRGGENVGTGVAMQVSADEAAKQMFDAYMASPGHKAAILDPKFNGFNTATIISANGARVFNTQHFWWR